MPCRAVPAPGRTTAANPPLEDLSTLSHRAVACRAHSRETRDTSFTSTGKDGWSGEHGNQRLRGAQHHPGKVLRLAGCGGTGEQVRRNMVGAVPALGWVVPAPDVLRQLQMCEPTLLPWIQACCLAPDVLVLRAASAPDVHTHRAPGDITWPQMCAPLVSLATRAHCSSWGTCCLPGT